MTEDGAWVFAFPPSALVDSARHQSFGTRFKRSTLADGGRTDSRWLDAEALDLGIQLTQRTITWTWGSEGGHRCSEAGYSLKVESPEVTNNGRGMGKRKTRREKSQAVGLRN